MEVTPEQRIQRTNPFTFKKQSFLEEAEANLSSYSNPYNWQANLATASDGASFAQVRVVRFQDFPLDLKLSISLRIQGRFQCRSVQVLGADSGQKTLTWRSSQKARAAELNAARARRAAQMQSIDDEIPDLSGPVSLGTYKFTRRGRGKKYETHKLSELKKSQEKEKEKEKQKEKEKEEEKEGDNKVTEPVPTSSTHSPSHPPPPTTISSLPLPRLPAHQIEVGINDGILNRLDNTIPEKRSFREPGPPQFDKFDPSHYAANSSIPSPSTFTDRQSFHASRQAHLLFPTAQDHRSSQDCSPLINPDTSSSQLSRQFYPSFPPELRSSNQNFTPTINPRGQSSQPVSTLADNSFSLQDRNSNQIVNVLINTNGQSSKTARETYPLLPPSDRQLDTSQRYSQLAKSLQALTKIEPHGETDSKVNSLLAANRQNSQPSTQDHRPESPKEYSSHKSLPLLDTLRTATFNLETNQWDPDLPEANMNPTDKSTSGGHASQQSSRMSRNPHAIVTTTKAGRPYTNPYMPIDPPPSTARPIVRESPSGHISRNTQPDDPEILQRQRQMRYVDQEEARYRALEQTKYGYAEESLDDPFQEQTTQIQHYGRNQPSNYAEHATQQVTYGRLPGYGQQSTLTTYTSSSGAQQALQAPSTGMTPYRGQRPSHEQQPVVNNRAQNPRTATLEQRSAYEQKTVNNPRASVRLPAVRGTNDRQKVRLSEPELESLSLEDSTGKNTQDQRRRHTQGGVQPASGRVSHAVPIRDPAAYTGSSLTTRRNQEVLRQNLDTVVASSKASARTVMNDPHRDRQPSLRPSSTVTDTTITEPMVTGSILRAQAPSYESLTTRRQATTNPNIRSSTSLRQGRAALGENEAQPLQYNADSTLKSPERAGADTEVMHLHESFQAHAMPPGFGLDVAACTKNAGLPAAAIGAGNAYMNELARKTPSKPNPRQPLEDAAAWFRHDPRDLSYAAAILSHETMNIMNPEQFPLHDTARRTVVKLADDSQDDDPSDRARQAATPRPIGHGRPAGLTTPPSNHGPRRVAAQTPFSTLSGVASTFDTEGMARSGREFLDKDAKVLEAMFGGVYSNLMAGKNGPYDYMNHYAPPPAYAIDHDPRNSNTFFDPQWFATAPPARVGRDPRREQGEYEDPTQGSAARRGDHARGEFSGRGGSGGSGGRGWGRN